MHLNFLIWSFFARVQPACRPRGFTRTFKANTAPGRPPSKTTKTSLSGMADFHLHVAVSIPNQFIHINPSNAEATFIQSTRTSKPCHVGIHWIAFAECSKMSYPYAIISVIFFKVFCIFLYWQFFFSNFSAINKILCT